MSKIIHYDEVKGHLIRLIKLQKNYYYIYTNTRYSFNYPERFIFKNGSYYFRNTNHFIISIVHISNNQFDLSLLGFYKNSVLKKRQLASINGPVARKLTINSFFINKSIQNFKEQEKEFEIISPISTSKNDADYSNRLRFWNKQGFDILNSCQDIAVQYRNKFSEKGYPNFKHYVYLKENR